MTLKPVESLQLSPRVALRPGDQFRTVRGSGPQYGTYPLGPFSVFRLVRLEANRTRIYAEAVDTATAMTHQLYVAGPRYKKGDTTYVPFKVKKA